ncbi:MAG: 3'-5' exonuclease [Bacteroidales bacterium]|jgi:DNA polymerase-3 subunit epsilon|nr:3'-5' exonuclease [Bacteroidales bacterium]
MELNLTKPIAFFDLETTGTNVGTDRIVEISVLKILPDETKQTYTKRLNPTIPISEESSKIHGITDADVADAPTFEQIAPELNNFLKGCDLSGYNCLKFDVPLLVEEFLRVGVDFDIRNRRIIDVQNIFHKMEQRTLHAAYQFYCDKDLTEAHSAEADTLATYEVLKAQLQKYEETPFIDKEGNKSFPVKNNVEQLHEFSHYHKNADLVGQIIFDEEGKEVFNFGKHKGRRVEDVFRKTPSYYDWMMNADFPRSTKKLITAIKMREFNQGESLMK